MRFEETHTYEVWEQRGGADPKPVLEGLTKEQAEGLAEDARVGARNHLRAEATPYHYMVVCASTTRREVH